MHLFHTRGLLLPVDHVVASPFFFSVMSGDEKGGFHSLVFPAVEACTVKFTAADIFEEARALLKITEKQLQGDNFELSTPDLHLRVQSLLNDIEPHF